MLFRISMSHETVIYKASVGKTAIQCIRFKLGLQTELKIGLFSVIIYL